MNARPVPPSNQPSSNDRDELIRLLPELADRPLPSDRHRQLQEFVMTHIQQDPQVTGQASRRLPRRRLALATSALAAVAVAVAVVAVGTAGFGLGGGKSGSTDRPGTSASTQRSAAGLPPGTRTFELAANYAAARPFTAPRPDQWIYVQSRELNPSSLAKDKGQTADVTTQFWKRADGTKMAGYNPETGKFETWDQDNGYPALTALPTDPQALLAALRAQLDPGSPRHGPAVSAVPGVSPGDRQPALGVPARTPEQSNALLFNRIAMTLDENLLPPAVTAALWRAAALIPGATQAPGTVEVDGRQVTVVGRIQEGWQFDQLLVDPDTYEFVGYRSVAVADHTYTGGPNGPVKVRKGEAQYTSTRLAAKIVDAAGQTR